MVRCTILLIALQRNSFSLFVYSKTFLSHNQTYRILGITDDVVAHHHLLLESTFRRTLIPLYYNQTYVNLTRLETITKMFGFRVFPSDVLVEILGYLSERDIAAAACSCKVNSYTET